MNVNTLRTNVYTEPVGDTFSRTIRCSTSVICTSATELPSGELIFDSYIVFGSEEKILYNTTLYGPEGAIDYEVNGMSYTAETENFSNIALGQAAVSERSGNGGFGAEKTQTTNLGGGYELIEKMNGDSNNSDYAAQAVNYKGQRVWSFYDSSRTVPLAFSQKGKNLIIYAMPLNLVKITDGAMVETYMEWPQELEYVATTRFG